jgi:hypothetical protein
MLHLQPETKTFRVWWYLGDSPKARCSNRDPVSRRILRGLKQEVGLSGFISMLWGGRRVVDCFQRDEVIGFPGRGQVETQFFQLWNCLLSSRMISSGFSFPCLYALFVWSAWRRGVGSPSACLISETTERISIKFCRPARLCVEWPRNRGSNLSRGKRFLSSPHNMLKREYLYKLLVYAIIHGTGNF